MGLEELTTRQVAIAIRGGALSAEEYAALLVKRATELMGIGAITTPAFEQLLESAAHLDRRRQDGGSLGPLAGVPFLVKDNIDVADLPTTACTPALRRNFAIRDAVVVARLRAADALILGKAAMHEMAMGGTSNNPGAPPVLNPYDPAVIAGGSSGGTAAGLAARLCPAGLGSDTGGSIPIPAALCGVTGLRPSMGRYSAAGLLVSMTTRDTIGPMARTVDDLRLIDEVILRYETPVPAGPRGIRLGMPTRYFWEDLEGDVEAVLSDACNRLRDAGFILMETEVVDVAALGQITASGLSAEASRDLPATLAALPGAPTLARVEAETASPRIAAQLHEIREGRGSEAALREALNVHRPRLRQAFGDAIDRHGIDVLLVPSTPLSARSIADDNTVVLNGRKQNMFVYTRNTRVVSCAGLPFLSLPAGLTPRGLPVGLGLVGRPDSDPLVLAVGAACEAAIGRLPKPKFVP
jgi:indoleacetamide hydrolase